MKIVYAIILSACFVGAENKTEFYKPIVKDVEGWTIAVAVSYTHLTLPTICSV